MHFILNEQTISTDEPPGITVLDFVRYRKNLKGTKIGCREGDCGACTVLVGELANGSVKYRTMTSCLMPLANAEGKHIVTIEGINPENRELTPVQKAMVEESGTQCGFCTVGFVMSLTGHCLDPFGGGSPQNSSMSAEVAISSIDGNICRCTGYKSIERAAAVITEQLANNREGFVPEYFSGIEPRLQQLVGESGSSGLRPPAGSVVGGGTDLYVQRSEHMADNAGLPLLFDDRLRGVRDNGDFIEIGASATVTDLLESPVMQSTFPDIYDHLKLVSSTPIRNMATVAGNFINASPIGDMTVWFLALDADIDLSETSGMEIGRFRSLKLRDLYLGYKQLAKQPDEIITAIRFKKPATDFRFNFEKVSKRTYLDIASVNTAISIQIHDADPPVSENSDSRSEVQLSKINVAHVSAGGVAPIPLYLKETSAFLRGREIDVETIRGAVEIVQSEISPISDVRGTERYKRILLTQLFKAHFVELFGIDA